MIDTPHVTPMTDDEVATRRRHLLRETATPVRSARRRPVLAGLAVAGTAAAAFGGLSLVGPGGGAAAYAGWTATPGVTTSTASARYEALCRARSTSTRGSEVVLVDRRGPNALVLFEGARYEGTCLLDHPDAEGGFKRVAVSTLSGPTPVVPPRPEGDRVERGGAIGEVDTGATVQIGRAGPSVRSIAVVLSDGRTVTADVSPDGYWSAWWVGLDTYPTSFRVTTSSGTTRVMPIPTASESTPAAFSPSPSA